MMMHNSTIRGLRWILRFLNLDGAQQKPAVSENAILAEIRRTRDEHARECGYDVHVLFERMRAQSAQLEAEGWRVVSSVSSDESPTIREEPPNAP